MTKGLSATYLCQIQKNEGQRNTTAKRNIEPMNVESIIAALDAEIENLNHVRLFLGRMKASP